MPEKRKETYLSLANISSDSWESDSGKQIISSISHELRTPLAIISSNIQMLKKFSYALDDRLVRETFSLCDEAISSMTDFIEDIHFLNTANKGRLTLKVEEIGLESFIADCINQSVTSDFNHSRIHLEMNLTTPAIKTDRLLLYKILDNLLDNALKFSGEVVNFRVYADMMQLIVDISDEGVGVPPDELSTIFEPFKRCENVRMLTGCGLGLAIVKKCSDMINARVEVESELGKRTTFKLIVPNHEC